MNLFYKPSISQLAQLIERSTKNSSAYHIIVDHDGEVLIDSNANLAQSALSKFKFYFADIHQNTFNGSLNDKYLIFLNQLYKNLVFCWEKEIHGEVDYYIISKIQNRSLRDEILADESMKLSPMLSVVN